MSALDELAKELSATVAEMVIARVRSEMTSVGRQNFDFFFTEEEAAEKLKISPKTLARERKDGAIDYTTYRGKIAYMPHHLLAYGLRNEVRGGKQEVSLKDVLASGNVLDFSTKKVA